MWSVIKLQDVAKHTAYVMCKDMQHKKVAACWLAKSAKAKPEGAHYCLGYQLV